MSGSSGPNPLEVLSNMLLMTPTDIPEGLLSEGHIPPTSLFVLGLQFRSSLFRDPGSVGPTVTVNGEGTQRPRKHWLFSFSPGVVIPHPSTVTVTDIKGRNSHPHLPSESVHMVP